MSQEIHFPSLQLFTINSRDLAVVFISSHVLDELGEFLGHLPSTAFRIRRIRHVRINQNKRSLIQNDTVAKLNVYIPYKANKF